MDSNKRCHGSRISETEFAVTTTGFDVFVFDITECVFDISKVKDSDILAKVCEDNEKDITIKKTKEMFVCRGKVIEKYKGENLIVYVDSALSKRFEFPEVVFYANSSQGRILVKDLFGRKVGAFLPMRFDETEVKE